VPGRIVQSDIAEVRARTDIADVVGEYVTLKRAGVDSMKGLCPFHDERTPSFHVRPQAGMYHCFGCNEGGDVYSFVMRMDALSFAETVERLAAKAGYQLHYENGQQTQQESGNRARLLAANRAAEEYFRTRLGDPDAEAGRRFLGERGFDHHAAERFGVGFAPKSYDALKKALVSQGFSEQELVAAGLIGQGDRGTYDRFRGRLVWPIRDTTGQTLGFGARRLFDDDQGPKYLNTPETAIYHKSQVLYGLDLARRDIGKAKQVVVVEGYTDVMACHLAGVTTAIATCGTSFGVDHIKVVRRMLGDVDNVDATGLGEVVFTFDPDEAGQKAASRAFAEEQRFAAQTFVAVAPDGLDPCDLRLKRGEAAVRNLVSQRRPMFEFMVRRVLASYDLETVEGRVAALRASAPVVAGIRDRALLGGYTRNLAGWLGMDPREVGRSVGAAQQRAAADDGGERGAGGRRPGRPGEGDPGEAPRPDRGPGLDSLPPDPTVRLERDALMAVLQHPDSVGRDLVAQAAFAGFANGSLAVVRDAVAASLDAFGSPDWVERVLAEVPLPFTALAQQLVVAPLPGRADQLERYCRDIVRSLLDRDLLRRKAELMGSLQRVDSRADPERFAEVQRDLVDVENRRRALRVE